MNDESMNKEYKRGGRAELELIYEDMGLPKEEIDKIIGNFCSSSEQCIVLKETLLYVSSACGGESSDKA